MAGFNIADFKSKIQRSEGIARNNKFLISFVAPGVALQYPSGQTFYRDVEFWCESVNLPGFETVTNGARRWRYGPEERRPFTPKFVPLLCNFIGDAQGQVYNFFNTWLTNIISHYTPQGFNGTPSRSAGMAAYEINYKSVYVTDVHVFTFKDDGEVSLHVVCKEAFPSHIMDLPLSWGQNNDFAQFQVVFNYLDWYQVNP